MNKVNTLPGLFNASEVRLAISCWSGYVAYAILYCLIYQHHILGNSYAFIESAFWVVQEWGSWIVIVPITVKWMTLNRSKRSALSVNLSLVVLLTFAGTTGRTIINVFTIHADILSSTMDFVTPNLAASIITVLIWRLSFKSKDTDTAGYDTKSSQNTILVQKGNSTVIVEMKNIDYLRSAGNYLEVHSNGKEYLVRDTMSRMLSRLPPDRFLKSHRSFAVNIKSIDRIISNSSGNATIALINGESIPLSRTQRRSFDQRFDLS